MNRAVALLAVTALFVSGIAIGAVATLLLREDRPPGGPDERRASVRQPFWDDMQRELQLSEEQVTRIQGIVAEEREASRRMRETLHRRAREHAARVRERIAGVLDDEQRGAFRRMVEDDGRMRGRAMRFLLEPRLAGPDGPGGVRRPRRKAPHPGL